MFYQHYEGLYHAFLKKEKKPGILKVNWIYEILSQKPYSVIHTIAAVMLFKILPLGAICVSPSYQYTV